MRTYKLCCHLHKTGINCTFLGEWCRITFHSASINTAYMSGFTIKIPKNEMFSSFDNSDYSQLLPFTPSVWFSIVPGT